MQRQRAVGDGVRRGRRSTRYCSTSRRSCAARRTEVAGTADGEPAAPAAACGGAVCYRSRPNPHGGAVRPRGLPNTSMLKQRTLKNSIRATGVGLHTGTKVLMTLRPAPPNTGIVFRRTDLAEPVDIPARAENVGETTLGTTLVKGDAQGLHRRAPAVGASPASASTTPSSRSAPPEVPIMDGSAGPFVFLLQSAGIEEQTAPEDASSASSARVEVARRRQVGALRSLRRFQGQLRDRVRPPGLQAPLAGAPRWTSPRPPS